MENLEEERDGILVMLIRWYDLALQHVFVQFRVEDRDNSILILHKRGKIVNIFLSYLISVVSV